MVEKPARRLYGAKASTGGLALGPNGLLISQLHGSRDVDRIVHAMQDLDRLCQVVVVDVVRGKGRKSEFQTSRYSEIVGVPVAALGLFAYAAMLICAIMRGKKAALSGAFVALIGVLFSAYLSYLEFFVLRAVCQWCVASAALVVAYLVLGALRLRDTGSDVSDTADGR